MRAGRLPLPLECRRGPRRRLARGLIWAALLLAAVAASSAAPLPGLAQGSGDMQAGLVIDFGDGTVHTACVDLGADGQATGEEVLAAAGFDVLIEYSPMGGAVCKIGPQGCNYPGQPCWCQCLSSPCVYWAYNHLQNGQWVYSTVGASIYTVRAGDVEGWAWGAGTLALGAQPPVRTFAEICAAPTATPTLSATPTATASATPTPSATPTASPWPTPTSPPTSTPTWTPQPSATWTAEAGGAPFIPATATATWSPTPTSTPTPTPTATPTQSPSATAAPVAASEDDGETAAGQEKPGLAEEARRQDAGGQEQSGVSQNARLLGAMNRSLLFFPLLESSRPAAGAASPPALAQEVQLGASPAGLARPEGFAAASQAAPRRPASPAPRLAGRPNRPTTPDSAGLDAPAAARVASDYTFSALLAVLLMAFIAGFRLRRRRLTLTLGRGRLAMGRPSFTPVRLPGRRMALGSSALVYGLSLGIGLLALLYPFLAPAAQSSAAGAARGSDAPLLLTVLVGLCLAALLFEVQDQAVNSKTIALLGVLVAINSVLRFVEVAIPGPGGFTPVFFLIILTGYVYGGRFGFLMGALTMLVSALITGGVGPWLPGQMFTAGWIGLSAPLARPVVRLLAGRPGGRAEVVVLAICAGLWGLLYGLIINLWFWPFMAGPAAMYWEVGLALPDLLRRYAAFYLATSLLWDSMAVAGNAALVAAFAAPTLRALRRFQQRFDFSYGPGKSPITSRAAQAERGSAAASAPLSLDSKRAA